jgi:hypothetical protein
MARSAAGECSAAALVVPAAERITVRIGGARQRSQAIKLLCEAAAPAAE